MSEAEEPRRQRSQQSAAFSHPATFPGAALPVASTGFLFVFRNKNHFVAWRRQFNEKLLNN
jgi:hypothetical protein